jgi:hypothetical protein
VRQQDEVWVAQWVSRAQEGQALLVCADLTATETPCPGTDLTLVYTVKDH